jgi:hypothetical protein
MSVRWWPRNAFLRSTLSDSPLVNCVSRGFQTLLIQVSSAIRPAPQPAVANVTTTAGQIAVKCL